MTYIISCSHHQRTSKTMKITSILSVSSILLFAPATSAFHTVTHRQSLATKPTRSAKLFYNSRHRRHSEPPDLEQQGYYLNPDNSNLPSRDAFVGKESRLRRVTYAPFSLENGRVGSLGAVGSNVDRRATATQTSPLSTTAAKASPSTSASMTAASRSYGIGAWNKSTVPAATSTALEQSYTPSTLRRPIVAGNWKLNPSTKSEARTLLKLLASNFLNHRDKLSSPSSPEVVIFPPLPYMSDAVQILEGTGIMIGAQNSGSQEKGAYTGEVAPSMLASAGCSHVLLGHSERRTIYGETDSDINARLHKCLEQPSLKVILCIGETLQEYESGMLAQVVDAQLRGGLEGVSPHALLQDRVIIAYEPVWAIGTGLVATPEQAQAAHLAIRDTMKAMYGEYSGVAETVRIQYGGSVTPDSIAELMGEADVDGALVGGASLNADSFTRIFDGATSADATKKMGMISYLPRELVAMEVLATKNALGESPVWSKKNRSLYWVSATEGEVWTWDLQNAPYRRLMNTAVGCIGLLRSNAPGSIIIAGESAMMTTSMVSTGGNPNNPIADFESGPSFLCHRPDHMTTTRPNDGRVDRFGNFVVGMYNQYHRSGASEGENNAGLYRLNSQTLEWQEILDYKFRVSNCICFSGDGKTMYFGDTPTRCVYAFDYSPDGPLTNRRLVWTMPSEMPGGPDGAQVDSTGKLWIAVTGAGRIVQINPETGVVEMVVYVDANPTSLTFGGDNLDEMFITTRAPNGGGLHRLKMPHGVRGLPEPEFGVGSSSNTSSSGFRGYLSTL
mmetsp:Transcript_14104/g.29674  ORF Transcript_14104/g.29674 Transcript_14104/m.29674 type:complete len:787 (+) Transcript_14104:228-2588(+)